MSGALLDSPAAIIRDLLVDLNLGNIYTNSTWPVRAHKEVDQPDNLITVYNTAGVQQGTIQIDGSIIEYHGLMIRVRSKNPETGFTKANSIATQLATVRNRTLILNSRTYLIPAVNQTGSIASVGRDKASSERYLHTINFVSNIIQQ